MIACLFFDLPEETEELDLALHAGDWHSALWGLDQWLRAKIKYEDRHDLVPAREELHRIMDEYGLEFK